jgi:hypothetical protein
MKICLLTIFLLIHFWIYPQKSTYYFDELHNRTFFGWEVKPHSGEIVFDESTNVCTVTMFTKEKVYKMYITSKLVFLRQKNFLYTLIDDNGSDSRIRIACDDEFCKFADLYFYSNRKGEKYYKLCLTKK